MSNRYKGGIISATPPTLVAGAGASGAWTLEQQMQATAAGLWPTNAPFFVEDVFQTWLYTGNQATQTMPNGVNLAGKGGLVWLKSRAGTTLAGYDKHILFDTVRGNTVSLSTNSTAANETGWGDSYLRFLSNGFDTGTGASNQQEYLNKTGVTYTSWTFAKQPKFFDVVTYTGNGANRTIAHNLGSVPGCIIVKSATNIGGWSVYHRGLFPPIAAAAGTTAPENYVILNTNAEASALSTVWNNTGPTDTVFSVGTDATVNTSGQSYVAYIFAHNAGGFGLTGTENVITCGQYQGLGDGTGPVVNLGFEPQWLLVKPVKDAGATRDWYIIDNMRGWTADGEERDLSPNISGAETSNGTIRLTATGFQPMGNDSSIFNGRFVGYIYIAIRRGPMKPPTTGTSVFGAVARTGTGANATVTGLNFAPDLVIPDDRGGTMGTGATWFDRLRGVGRFLYSSFTNAENTGTTTVTAFNNNGINLGADTNGDGTNRVSIPFINWFFGRAPGFFDEVCYTGTGVARTVAHNLTVVPEMMIVKQRTSSGTVGEWWTYHQALGNTKFLVVNATQAEATFNLWNNTSPTSSVFSVSTYGGINASGNNYVAYLFASCPGVSKVGSYTGTGAAQVINCGFTGGARFVLIKRTNASGDWYVWDTARGMIPANDPYLLLNSTAAEVTGTDFVDTAATGFEITSTAPAAINASGGTFIFLAIA